MAKVEGMGERSRPTAPPQIDGAGILELLISVIGSSRAFSLERTAKPAHARQRLWCSSFD